MAADRLLMLKINSNQTKSNLNKKKIKLNEKGFVSTFFFKRALSVEMAPI